MEMVYGDCGWVMAKGRETKDMRRPVAFRPEVLEEGTEVQIGWKTSRPRILVPRFSRQRDYL
jgi:hypothetical protein